MESAAAAYAMPLCDLYVYLWTADVERINQALQQHTRKLAA